MHAIATRWANLPPRDKRSWSLPRLLTMLASAAIERLTLPQRDVPPEFYRFPPF